MSDETEYNGGYKRVWGVKFKQPESDNHGLNEEWVFEDSLNVFFALVGVIPVVGFAFAFSLMFVALAHRDENSYCIDENFWKAGVISMVLQVVSISALFLIAV